jgi:hypothetical protein
MSSVVVRFIRLAVVLISVLIAGAAQEEQKIPDDLIQATKQWLKDSSLGDRTQLNASMDPRFLATTPAGDVLSKERLVPTELSKPVQKLPSMELDGPIARAFADTGVVMCRLRATEGPDLNGSFVFVRSDGKWKLVAVHLSPR